MISVENVVADNFPGLEKARPKIHKTVLAVFRYLFHEREFKLFEEAYPHLKGFDFVDQVLDYFSFSYSVSNRDKERIPVHGRLVIIANHPIGSLDGLALLQLVGGVRRDVKVVANDLLLALDPLRSLLLPVDNMGNRTARQNIRQIEQHLNNEGAIIIFPAGEVSRIRPNGVRDGAWNRSFLRFASKTGSPILPIHVNAHNSVFFYSLSFLSKPLSTLWLVREMFKQARRDIRIHIGSPIEHKVYDNLPFRQKSKIKLFKKHVYRLSRKRGIRCFQDNMESIAHPEQRQQLRDEIRSCELIGSTADNMHIYLYNFEGDSTVMREVARLREVSFRAVGEGSGKRRDMDRYDSYYDHIILWDDEQLELVGAYRLVRTAEVVKDKGVDALYTSTLFDYQEDAGHYLSQAVELGRSFVQPRYWGKRSLDYLWFGIGAYVNRYPEVRYLLGPVSISNSYTEEAKQLLVSFYQSYFPAASCWVVAKTPYHVGVVPSAPRLEYKAGFAELKQKMASMDVNVPTLYKQYSEVCEHGGVQFVDFNVDENFSDCVDGMVTVDLQLLKASKRKRYIESNTIKRDEA